MHLTNKMSGAVM